MKLNLGCGKDIKEGYLNLDIVDYGGNMIHDINTFPYPFEDNTFDEIFASHVLEHLYNFNKSISELYRIAKPDATVIVYGPFFLNTKFFGEPDHRIPFSIRTFDNYEFLGNRKLKFYEKWKLVHRTNYGSQARFEILEKKFITSHFAPLKWMDPILNIEPVLYERFFAGIFSPEEVFFRLRVVKEMK
jgi:ubiquinone/menaquinone biosynthesis C-methylase UbiE